MSPVAIGFLLILLPYGAKSATFQTSHPKIAVEKATVEFKCNHDDSSLSIMLWYQQTESGRMMLVGYSYIGSVGVTEELFEDRFEITRKDIQTGGLILHSANLSDSAVYFCAARRDKNYPAYFGQGTKLTVLENNRDPEPPTVKVLPPSLNECRNKKDSKRKKTLVCVASEFYPDHVSVFWQIDGYNVTEGVATDDAALRPEGGRNYTITSRLRVSAESWFTPTREFKCLVEFYNGKAYETYEDSINGVEAPAKGNAITREKYLRVTQTAKLSYAVFIVKSSIYGAFVAFLVWKLQGKQNN